MIAVDGSDLGAILHLAGAPAGPDEAARARLEALEAGLGIRLPAETRALLSRPPALRDPEAERHLEIDPLDFFAGLPDVEAFCDRLATELAGPLAAACQFYGMVPVSVRVDRGDFLWALAAIDAYAGDRLGGIFGYDERELAPLAPTASQFLLDELRAFQTDAPLDCYRFEVAGDLELPAFAPMPPAIDAAFAEHGTPRTGGRERFWICAALRGEIASWALDALPTPERWAAERERVGRFHGDAMYWLLAHAVLGNRDELADAVALSRANPSRLVAAVRDYLVEHPGFADRHRELRRALYELAGTVEL